VEEIQCAVTRELNNISKTAFLEGMKKLSERANGWIDQGGMYLENKNKLCPYKKLSMFYNSCLKTFGLHLIHQVNREGSVLNSNVWLLAVGKCVRLFVEVMLLIAGARASEHYMEIFVSSGPWEKSDLTLLLTGE
jgi:hypothetical protein